MDEDVLTLPTGRFRVLRDGRLVRALGVRYARAHRFQEATGLPVADGVTDATRRGAACPQLPSRLEFVVGPLLAGLSQDEDCLTLAIVAPAPDGTARPVMVYFHGGAYVSGSGQAPSYDMAAIADEGDVVAVTVNYRLGIFGYLAIDGVAPANLGLLDQLAALRWVRDNITGFGGDPSNVTVLGQSAGADSVSYLMIADGAENLFRRAIVQSAPLGIQRGRAAMSRAMGAAAREVLGAHPETSTTADLLAAQQVAASAAVGFGPLALMPFGPQTGHRPLPADDRVEARLREVAAGMPLMIGSTADDALPFLTLNPRVAPKLDVAVIGPLARRFVGAYYTGRMFRRPAGAFAKRHRRGGGHAVTYVFDWSPADGPFGASHCIELPFLMGSFDAWARSPMLGSDQRETLTKLGPPMRQLWYEFARGMFDGTDTHLRLPGTLEPH
jgi:para-nitrobenzyl esterase